MQLSFEMCKTGVKLHKARCDGGGQRILFSLYEMGRTNEALFDANAHLQKRVCHARGRTLLLCAFKHCNIVPEKKHENLISKCHAAFCAEIAGQI